MFVLVLLCCVVLCVIRAIRQTDKQKKRGKKEIKKERKKEKKWYNKKKVVVYWSHMHWVAESNSAQTNIYFSSMQPPCNYFIYYKELQNQSFVFPENLFPYIIVWPYGKLVTISRIRDKFETDCTVQDVYKQRSGRPGSSMSGEKSATVLQQFT
jgi:hypothetical protein